LLRPQSFAWYIAKSAFSSNPSASLASSGYVTIPMLAVSEGRARPPEASRGRSLLNGPVDFGA
jgi:hypothetical protein